MRRLPAIATVAILATGSAIATLGTAHAATGNAVLKGSIPAWANSKNLVGTANPSGDVGFRVYLGWSMILRGAECWRRRCPIRRARATATT